MYEVYAYVSKNGQCPIDDYLDELIKNGRRNEVAKIMHYINLLKKFGYKITNIPGQQYAKQLTKDIYELRPGRNRVLFIKYVEGSFVLLHAFTKKTPKTPPLEIEKAEKEALECKDERTIIYEKYKKI